MALPSRGHEIHVSRDELPGNSSDKQSRYIEAAINGIVVGCIYLPNGNPQPGPKFEYKLAWFERLIRHARSVRKITARPKRAGRLSFTAGERLLIVVRGQCKGKLYLK